MKNAAAMVDGEVRKRVVSLERELKEVNFENLELRGVAELVAKRDAELGIQALKNARLKSLVMEAIQGHELAAWKYGWLSRAEKELSDV